MKTNRIKEIAREEIAMHLAEIRRLREQNTDMLDLRDDMLKALKAALPHIRNWRNVNDDVIADVIAAIARAEERNKS